MVFDVVAGPVAAELAGVSYRQLDHWARQGWVAPSMVAGRHRRYSLEDVTRLGLLRHVGSSGMNLSRLGPLLAGIDLAVAGWVVVDAEETVTVLAAGADLTAAVTLPGLRCVFDAASFRQRLEHDAMGQPVSVPAVTTRAVSGRVGVRRGA